MIVTIRSSSSEVTSPALKTVRSVMCLQLKSCIPLVQVDIGFLADQVGVSSAHTLDFGQGVHDLLLAIDIGVEDTENELDYKSVNIGRFGIGLLMTYSSTSHR